MRSRACTGAIAVVPSMIAMALGPALAHADTTARVDGNVLTVESGLVQSNDLTLTKDSNSNIVRVTEAAGGPRVDAKNGCAQPSNRQASCALPAGGSVSVRLREGLDDSYNGTTLPFRQSVDGGGGQDRISTGPGNDALKGGANLLLDFLDGGPGSDRLDGESGDDHLTGGPGGDTLIGGSGTDIVRYELFQQNTTVDLGAGFASVFGEPVNDTVFGDVEDVRAGGGSDTLTGDQGDNTLSGEFRDFNGAPPASGRSDTITGLGGDDVIRAGQNRATDTVSCGPGDDDASLDLTDLAVTNTGLASCELIQAQPVDEHAAATIRKGRARVARGRILVPLRCSANRRRICRGKLTVRRRGGPALGRARYRIRGRGRTVSVPLSRTGRRLVRARGRLRVEMTARERASRGRTKHTVARFRLRGS